MTKKTPTKSPILINKILETIRILQPITISDLSIELINKYGTSPLIIRERVWDLIEEGKVTLNSNHRLRIPK